MLFLSGKTFTMMINCGKYLLLASPSAFSLPFYLALHPKRLNCGLAAGFLVHCLPVEFGQ